MKIEVGESLMRSWLRHVQQCQVAELNWKPSATWTSDKAEKNLDAAQKLMDHTQAFFQTHLAENIFKRTKTAAQLMKQAELDVLGLKMRENIVEQVIGVDIAFHERGLNYGGTSDTIIRVLKKLIRSTMIARYHFQSIPSQIIFASPFVGKTRLNPLIDAVDMLKECYSDLGIETEISLIMNENFKTEIINPTLARAETVADTSEIFLRSYQLLSLFDHVRSSKSAIATNHSPTLPDRNNSTLKIELEPTDPEEFKQQLLKHKTAKLIIDYSDGRTEERQWNAQDFSETSNLLGNIRSRKEFRQGEWQRRGISRLKVKIAA